MNKSTYYVIGVMSGTSLDGVDIAYIEFNYSGSWSFKLLDCTTVSYSNDWLNQLKNLVNMSKAELQELDISYTNLLGSFIADFIKENNIKLIDAVCSHGHTALHNPDEGYTYQIGNLEVLSQIVKHKVICDFRTQDVALGGQGAPLVPIGDALLFSKYDSCVNLGGFSNISKGDFTNRMAYDICPVNIVLNHYVRKLGLSYDDAGLIARSGTVNTKLVDLLNAFPYYKLEPPKSLGLEWVLTDVLPLIDSFNLEVKDILCSFVEHVAIQLAKHLSAGQASLFTGGGVYNTYLMERLSDYSEAEIKTENPKITEFKEALIFGFLGVLKLRNEVNCLASVTGASKDHCSGVVYDFKSIN